MNLPELYWTRRNAGTTNSGAQVYEHTVMVLLPYRRYRREYTPRSADGSPSDIEVGEVTRHGTELLVSRRSIEENLDQRRRDEMHGELVEAWVSMTAWDHASRIG